MLKILNSAVVLDNQFVKITEETVRFPSGMIDNYYVVTSKSDRAMVCLINEDNKMLLIREYRHGCKDYVWQFPAGCIDNGESPEAAASRELMEETGIAVKDLCLEDWWYVSPPRMPDKIFIFTGKCHNTVIQDKIERNEIVVEREWFSLSELLKMLFRGEIKDPHTCVLILRFVGKYEMAKMDWEAAIQF